MIEARRKTAQTSRNYHCCVRTLVFNPARQEIVCKMTAKPAIAVTSRQNLLRS